MRTVTKLAATTLTAAAFCGILGLSPAVAAAASTPTDLATVSTSSSIAPPAGIELPASTEAITAEAISTEAGDSDAMETANFAYHRGFSITNNSRFTLRLVGYEGDHFDDQLPPLDTIVRPGESIGFQLAVLFLRLHEVTATFEVTDAAGGTLWAPYRVLLCVDELTYGGNLMLEIPAPMKQTGRDQSITLSDDPLWSDGRP